jgi:hypothetical protein
MASGIALMLATSPLVAADASFSFTGTAYDDNDEPIYEEAHVIKGRCEGGMFLPQSQQVTYRETGDSGEQIASKELSFEQSPLRPSFVMTQPGFNEKMRVTNKDDETVIIQWDDPDGETHNSTLQITDDMVFDSGFVHLIQRNWKALNSGENISFEFLSATRAETYSFEATTTDEARIDAHITIRMQPAGTILGWLVDPITLGFDKQGRLTDYLGLTNLRKDGDNNYRAHLRYDVPELPCALVKNSR